MAYCRVNVLLCTARPYHFACSAKIPHFISSFSNPLFDPNESGNDENEPSVRHRPWVKRLERVNTNGSEGAHFKIGTNKVLVCWPSIIAGFHLRG